MDHEYDDSTHRITIDSGDAAKVTITAFTADNAESLQGGLRKEQKKDLTGLEDQFQLHNVDLPYTVPLTFRWTNYLQNLAENERVLFQEPNVAKRLLNLEIYVGSPVRPFSR
ncbi:hypothetical protein BLNAU_11873 [Blattamonas nauphoetae]|uniref:Uncharacterized protein n=1 Tax=Blattamonas nauphoetae TaxID=2049346 RepID=A0ABQ9XP19_9EUKA|nr:hypothetical protein BLNAU_11873 [Blattamonas nauphoetae]